MFFLGTSLNLKTIVLIWNPFIFPIGVCPGDRVTIRPKENLAWTTNSLILWSNDATKKEWRQNLCKTYVEKHINNSAEVWPFHCGHYCDIRLFVWYCLCVKLNRRARTGDRHKKDIENALKNPWLIVTWPVTVQGLIVNYR